MNDFPAYLHEFNLYGTLSLILLSILFDSSFSSSHLYCTSMPTTHPQPLSRLSISHWQDSQHLSPFQVEISFTASCNHVSHTLIPTSTPISSSHMVYYITAPLWTSSYCFWHALALRCCFKSGPLKLHEILNFLGAWISKSIILGIEDQQRTSE